MCPAQGTLGGAFYISWLHSVNYMVNARLGSLD